LLERADIVGLRERARLHHTAAGRDLSLRGLGRRPVFLPEMTYDPIELCWSHVLPLCNELIEPFENCAPDSARGLRPGQNDNIAMSVSFDTEPILEQCEVGVEFSEQAGEMAVVFKGYDNPLTWRLGFLHSPFTCCRQTAKSCQTMFLHLTE